MNRIYLAAAAGLLALLSIAPGALRAAVLEGPIALTINEPVTVQSTVLLPGTYLVKSVSSYSTAGVVMIFNQAGKRLATSEINNVERNPGSPETSGYSLYESTPGTVPALHNVFAAGQDIGIEFPAPR